MNDSRFPGHNSVGIAAARGPWALWLNTVGVPDQKNVPKKSANLQRADIYGNDIL
jgi:hypothetical protein